VKHCHNDYVTDRNTAASDAVPHAIYAYRVRIDAHVAPPVTAPLVRVTINVIPAIIVMAAVDGTAVATTRKLLRRALTGFSIEDI